MSSTSPSTSRSATVTHGTAKGPNLTSSATGTSNISFMPHAKQASSIWRDFENALKALTEHSSLFSTVVETVDQYNALKNEVQQKNARIDKLESSHEIHIEQSTKRQNKWEKEKTELERRLSEEKIQGERKVKKIENDLATKARVDSEKQAANYSQEIKELKKELSTEKKKVAARNEELEKANTKAKADEVELGRYTNRLKEWESYLSLLKTVDFAALCVICRAQI